MESADFDKTNPRMAPVTKLWAGYSFLHRFLQSIGFAEFSTFTGMPSKNMKNMVDLVLQSKLDVNSFSSPHSKTIVLIGI